MPIVNGTRGIDGRRTLPELRRPLGFHRLGVMGVKWVGDEGWKNETPRTVGRDGTICNIYLVLLEGGIYIY